MSDSETISTDFFRETAANIEAEVGKLIVGQQDVVRHVLVGILSGGHVLLEGVPGLGKTMLIRTLGQVLTLDFSRDNQGSDLVIATYLSNDGFSILGKGEMEKLLR